MKKFYTIFSILLLFITTEWASAQTATIKGRIIDNTGQGLSGATVTIQGSSVGSAADVDGNYTFSAAEGKHVLVATFIGYTTKKQTINATAGVNTVNFTLEEGDLELTELVVTGSRNKNRIITETAVPVDVISIEDIAQGSPQVEITQILNYVAPSFSSNKQTISDGTDHVDPASLRGLGVDHVLVLINGKRRHSSALVNVNGTVGRGSVGTDMNTIPTASIERIEILRDGASAQYGSDAIAGVINIILKKSTNVFTGSVTTGQMYKGDGESLLFSGNYGFDVGKKGYINVTGQYQYRGRTDRSGEYAGSVFRTEHPTRDSSGVDSLYVLPSKGLYSELYEAGDWSPFSPGTVLSSDEATAINNANNITNTMTVDEETAKINELGGRRAFSLKAGDSQVENAGLVVNAAIPLNDNAEFYAFGTLNRRTGFASGFYRYSNQSRTMTTIYPIGFLPEINSKINDIAFTAGIRGEINDWDVDFSNTYGSNDFQYIITNTNNASLGTSSPTTFNAGGFKFSQNTSNLDFSKYFDNSMSGINVALGAEFRTEEYKIIAGEEGSYRNYGNYKTLDTANHILSETTTNIFYDRPGASQVFPGFSPSNVLLESRNAVGVYGDVEFNFTKNFFVDIAARFENFSDFGSTLNGKVALRWAITDKLALRAASSTGFRAPSLHQRYFNSTATLFQVEGGVTVANEVGTFRNDSRVANLLGIESLKAENATNLSMGVTFDVMPGFTISVDGYSITVEDRVNLTNSFSKEKDSDGKNLPDTDSELNKALNQANAGSVTFFVNGIDTRTSGVDLIASYTTVVGEGNLNFTLGANFTETTVEKINVPDALKGSKDRFFNRENESQFETATPKSKISLGVNYSISKLQARLNFVYFGSTIARTGNYSEPDGWIDQTFAGKGVTDLSLGYNFTDNLVFTVGANNILDVYPDKNIEAFNSNNRFLYSRRVTQFGANGGYYFARLNFKF